MGALTNIVKQYVPASYAAMIGATNAYYSIDELQSIAEYVQTRLYATVVNSIAESSVYTIKEQRLVGILTTLHFIPAAIDFWGDKYASVSTNPTSESVSHFDHRPDLWKIYDRLSTEAKELGTDLGVNIYAASGVVPRVSYGDNGREILITSDPSEFPLAYDTQRGPVGRDLLPWEVL